MAEISAWRVNDVVAYDVMRESATTLTALLVEDANFGAARVDIVTAEIAQWRHEVLTVPAYDRVAVTALAERIDSRIAELSGPAT